MNICNHRVGIHNYCAGVRDRRMSICNYGVRIRNHDVSINGQLSLKGAAKLADA